MRISLRETSFYCYFLVFMMVVFVVFYNEDHMVLAAEAKDSGGDSLFENQIRSMTAIKPPLKPSGDIRFQDNQDGTVADSKHGLMWKQKDSYQEKKEWTNWEAAHLYIEKINKNKFAGYSDWRLPLRKELLTLYEEDKSIPWFYYWTTNEVHMDPIFGYTSCCFWTSEEHKEIYAWHVNFLRGKSYPSIKKGKKNQAAGSASLSVVRAVRGVGVNLELEPEVQSETQPEVQPEAQLEAQPEIQLDN